MKKQITLLLALMFSAFTFGQATSTGTGSGTTMMQNQSNGSGTKKSRFRCESVGTATNRVFIAAEDGSKSATVIATSNATATDVVTTALSPTYFTSNRLNGLDGTVTINSENLSTSFLGQLVMNPLLFTNTMINDNTGANSLFRQKYDTVITYVDNISGKTGYKALGAGFNISQLKGSTTQTFENSNDTKTNFSVRKLNFQKISSMELDTGYLSLTQNKPNDVNTKVVLNFVKEGDGFIGVFEASKTGSDYTYGHTAHNSNISTSAELYEYNIPMALDTKGYFVQSDRMFGVVKYDFNSPTDFKKNEWEHSDNGYVFRTNITDISNVQNFDNSNYMQLDLSGFETKFVDGSHNTFSTLSAKSGGIVGIAEDAGAASKIDLSATDGTNYSSLVMNTGQLNWKVESSTDISTHILSPTALTTATQTATTTTTFGSDEVQTIQQSYIKTTTANDGSNTTQFDQTATEVTFYEQSSPQLTIGSGGRIKIAAGSTAAGTAPIKLQSGSLMTATENGAIEYDGTNLSITTGGTRKTLDKTLTNTASLNFPSTADNSSSTLTITVTGAADGDVVSVGVPSASFVANTSYWAYVSSANTVTVVFMNNDDLNTADPAPGTFRVSVSKY